MSDVDSGEPKPKNISRKKQLTALFVAFLLGAIWVFAIRFVTIQKKEVHYHANFAVFIDGERVPFDNFIFYEEIQSCFDGEGATPQTRVHMHDSINHVIHVHDYAVTWGHFFANINMTNGDIVFRNGSDVYVEDEDTQITFILNGSEVATTSNRIIENEDVLLVSIGEDSDEEIQNQYSQIEKNAAEYNEKQDPSSCAGGKPFTLWERAKATIGIGE
jgi:hypothetical protein